MKPYIEAELHDIIENLKSTVDIKEMTIEEEYLLLKEEIKKRKIPVEIFYDPERLDSNCLWILAVNELNKPIKIVFEGEYLAEEAEKRWWQLVDTGRI